ncbi:cell-cycle control medial ring component [Xylaria bambusicola]|uniref:cell-cycle control medial ring component n=1 Tax=Xylaria bambusicola TaxID=326684 RepID=UPI00200869BC|nr:cell-cycle control medial ring component [Xylaria bambusicola]KAI0508342.1 cell-cycle control medial ring component [Xylaria bambusicola]
MTEVSFAKSFLAALDGRPIKLSPDHVEDPKTYQARGAYTLPKMPKTMSKRKGTSVTPGQERSLVVTVKSLRNPPLDLRLSSQTLNTSVHDIKASVAKETGIAENKIKVLHKKKPVPDSKVLKDLVSEDDTAVEFSVMVMGGAASAAATTGGKQDAQHDVAQGLSGADVLQTEDFWADLKGFLLQRIRDEQLAAELASTFQEAWKTKS